MKIEPRLNSKIKNFNFLKKIENKKSVKPKVRLVAI